MSDNENKAEPSQFTVEVGGLQLSDEDVAAIQNDVARLVAERVQQQQGAAQAFKQWASFKQWKSFARAT